MALCFDTSFWDEKLWTKSAHTKLLDDVQPLDIRSVPRSLCASATLDQSHKDLLLYYPSRHIVTSYSTSDHNLRRLKANDLGLFYTPRYGLINDLDLARSKFDTKLSDSFEMSIFV